MSTTTIRLEDELKARINAAAAQAGKTAHAFILDSLAQTVEQVELDNAFHAVADERWARIRAWPRCCCRRRRAWRARWPVIWRR